MKKPTNFASALIHLVRAEKMLPRAHAGSRRGAIFTAQPVKLRRHGIRHPRIKLHFRCVVIFQLSSRDCRSLRGQFLVRLIRRTLWAASRVGHAVLVFRRVTPDFPP
jgi:hypothetical protein